MITGPGMLLAAVLTAAPTPSPLDRALSRVSEEAEAFQNLAPKMLSEETFVQRALQPPRRFRPRLGAAALESPKPQYRTREIVSEYGFSTFRDAPGVLHEFRQVVSVDGKRKIELQEARRTLVRGVRSSDDRRKQRMLDEFRKLGLREAASDFGQVLLLFARPRLGSYAFEMSGSGRVGAEPARIIGFRQRGGPGSLLIFENRKALHQALEGELWVREPDGLPLRVVLRTSRQDGKVVLRDEATVDYAPTPHGVVMPASVVHREFEGDLLRVENVLRYSPFRMFSADADIEYPPAKK